MNQKHEMGQFATSMDITEEFLDIFGLKGKHVKELTINVQSGNIIRFHCTRYMTKEELVKLQATLTKVKEQQNGQVS